MTTLSIVMVVMVVGFADLLFQELKRVLEVNIQAPQSSLNTRLGCLPLFMVTVLMKLGAIVPCNLQARQHKCIKQSD
jgi:hypothetical protein